MTSITMDQVRSGSNFTVLNLPTGDFKMQLLRLGISEGDTIACSERLPGGTIVLRKVRQEIAVGYDLARQIEVSVQ